MRTFRGLCIPALLITFGVALGQAGKPVKDLDYEALAKLLEQPGKVYFLDVREPEEIARLGSIKGYVNIPLSQLDTRLKEIPKDKLVVTL